MSKTTICHCNIKENAELIAQILDTDAEGATFVYEIPDPYTELREYVKEFRENWQEERDRLYQLWKDEEDHDKRFRLTMVLGAERRCIQMLDDILYYLETGDIPYCECQKIPKGGDLDA